MSLICSLTAMKQPPEIMIVHMSENRLGFYEGFDLIIRAKRDLGQIHTLFPGVVVNSSEMLQQRVWQGATGLPQVDKARRCVNQEMAKFVPNQGGLVITHTQILFSP